jgi:hypothetical protein
MSRLSRAINGALTARVMEKVSGAERESGVSAHKSGLSFEKARMIHFKSLMG